MARLVVDEEMSSGAWGLIVGHREDGEMVATIDAVTEDYGLEKPPETMLADGLMSSGENIVGCADREVDLVSPIKL